MANKGVVAPRLPSAPDAYDPTFFNQMLNVLRQYFNGLDTPGPMAAATQRKSATEIVAALSCTQPDKLTGAPVISMPTQADLANLRSGDIYMDTSGGVAASYPLRIKA